MATVDGRGSRRFALTALPTQVAYCGPSRARSGASDVDWNDDRQLNRARRPE